VAINPNNEKRMASTGYDNTVRIWDLDEMKVISIIDDKSNKHEKEV